VVDDEPANRDLLGRRLRRMGHEVAEAATGEEALAAMRGGGVDLVLLDIMLPDISGIDVLARIRAEPAWRHIPVLMVSALDEMASVIRCIELGAEDYLPKPFDPVLLRARVDACLVKKRSRDREQLYARSLERELEIGREIQGAFLPDSLPQPAGWEIAAHFEPARQVAGDFYDVFPLGDGSRLALAIGDVCGKGVGAALFMALTRTLVRAHAEREAALESSRRAPDDSRAAAGMAPLFGEGSAAAADDAADAALAVETVRAASDYIAGTHGASNMFATMFFAVLRTGSGRLAYVNAGHDPPLVVSEDGVTGELTPTGPAVGLFPGSRFAAAHVELAPGSLLFASTDGVAEARATTGEFLGVGAVTDRLAGSSSAHAAVAAIAEVVHAHLAGAEQGDDVTMLAVRRGGS
jgi:serine phosphatase RsbU (regulator of sigma subunit)